MAVSTDLTNTTWVFNNEISTYPSGNTTYYINFTSTNTNYTQLKLNYNDGKKNVFYDYDSVFYGAMWLNDNYKTIEITGGTDSTNTTLIAWLTQNATQQSTTKTYKLGWRLKPAVSLISFTIRSISYQAESGMTWQQWVNSEYNTSTFIIDDNYVKTSALGLWVGSAANTPVMPTDTILADTAYGAYGGGEN